MVAQGTRLFFARSNQGFPDRGIGAHTGVTIGELPTAANWPRAMVHLEVKRHPTGGWTLAEPIDATRSTQRIYRGWWSTRRAATAALEAKFS